MLAAPTWTRRLRALFRDRRTNSLPRTDRQANDLRAAFLAFELQRRSLQRGVEAGSRGSVDGDEDLARARDGGEPGGDVHSISEHGDVGARPLADGAEPWLARVHARAHRNPWAARIPMARCS